MDRDRDRGRTRTGTRTRTRTRRNRPWPRGGFYRTTPGDPPATSFKPGFEAFEGQTKKHTTHQTRNGHAITVFRKHTADSVPCRPLLFSTTFHRSCRASGPSAYPYAYRYPNQGPGPCPWHSRRWPPPDLQPFSATGTGSRRRHRDLKRRVRTPRPPPPAGSRPR